MTIELHPVTMRGITPQEAARLADLLVTWSEEPGRTDAERDAMFEYVLKQIEAPHDERQHGPKVIWMPLPEGEME